MSPQRRENAGQNQDALGEPRNAAPTRLHAGIERTLGILPRLLSRSGLYRTDQDALSKGEASCFLTVAASDKANCGDLGMR